MRLSFLALASALTGIVAVAHAAPIEYIFDAASTKNIEVGNTVYQPQVFEFDFYSDTSTIAPYFPGQDIPSTSTFSAVFFTVDGDTYDVTSPSYVFVNHTTTVVGFGFSTDYLDISGLDGMDTYGLDTSYTEQMGAVTSAIEGQNPVTSGGNITMVNIDNPRFEAIFGAVPPASGVPDHSSALALLGFGLLGLGLAGRRELVHQA